MLTAKRCIIAIFVVVAFLHFLIRYNGLEAFPSHFTYLQSLNEDNITTPLNINASKPIRHKFSYKPRANATFILLCRNSDLSGVVSSIQQMEDRFNKQYKYPWVLLNEEPFPDEFKSRVNVLTDAPIFFGQIPHEHWYQPDWIDENRAREGRMRMMWQGIIYASSVPYRNMCRFNSGFFFHHELLKPYRYYWRVEPDVKFFCDVGYDPFLYMQRNDKIYGFTISLVEWEPTIPTLWSAVKEFIADNPQYVERNNSMAFLSDNGGDSYNLCHYWSNFEIADMDFWRGEAYQAFFKHLESKGGFYYEVWCTYLGAADEELISGVASAGGMHPFTALLRPFLPGRTKYISFMTLGTDMILFSIVLQEMSGLMDVAPVTRLTVLVSEISECHENFKKQPEQITHRTRVQLDMRVYLYE